MSNSLGETILYAVGIALVPALLVFLRKLYNARARMYSLQRQRLPMPPYNPLFGHLLFCKNILSKLPKDAHPDYLPDMIRREVPDLGPVYYLDTWPFGPQMLVVASPGSIYQVAQEHPLQKYHMLKSFLLPITEGLDIVTMEGQVWKTWRGVFKSGFSASHLMTLTFAIVEETRTFCERLRRLCDTQEIFAMKGLTDFLALDVIGRVVLDTQLDSQKQSNPLVDGLRTQIRWLIFGLEASLFTRLNPIRPFVVWYNLRRMNNYLSPRIDDAMAKVQDTTAKKSIINLALAALSSDTSGAKLEKSTAATVKQIAMSQIKLFLFSGHDTTSSALCYLFYALSRNPPVLERLRAEHDRVFGSSDENTIASKLANDAALLNRLPYTHAVIKETLRLYPPVSSIREGEAGFNVTDDDGRHFPTDGFLVWANQHTVQRDPAYWSRPDEFWPDRWLTIRNDPAHPIKGAWRPFEFGPRNCIGQELAVIEMKIVLVMTARSFVVKPAYEEVDRVKGRKKVDTVYGERGYQIQRAQPSRDLPCRVFRNVDSETTAHA